MPNKFRVVKQFSTGSASDPSWATNDGVYVAVLSGSSDTLYEFEKESDAWMKMVELSGSDSTKRKYNVIEI